MIDTKKQHYIDELVAKWQAFFNAHEQWQDLIQGYAPISSPCGIVYELPNMLNRPNEGLAIVDMRHYFLLNPIIILMSALKYILCCKVQRR